MRCQAHVSIQYLAYAAIKPNQSDHMTTSRRTRPAYAFLLAACLSFSSSANAAELARDPSSVIASLADRIYSVGETTGNAEEMIAAEASAADEIRRYISSGSTAGLLGKEQERQSPLTLAAYLGYPNVVSALLTSDLVRLHINDAGEKGMTPWIASILSLKQAALACNPKMIEDPSGFIPFMVTQPYYLSNPVPPYAKITGILVAAGAASSPGDAKAVWLALCKGQSADGIAKIKTSVDLQKTVQELGLLELISHLQNLQKKVSRHAN